MADQLTPLQRAFAALEASRAKLARVEAELRAPVAIIGVGCRTAADGDSPEALWRIFHGGVDTMDTVPRSRWDIDAWYDANPEAAGKIVTKVGGFIDDAAGFDAELFGIAPREARGLDPQQRLFLEVSWAALEHAGIAPDRLQHSATGVYLGICSSDYLQQLVQAGDPGLLDAHFMSGNAHSVAAGRLSYVLGLEGPSVAVDTACSSSLVALHLACQALRTGECRLALAGGVNLMLSPENYVAYSRAGLLAPDGRCKAFDATADGIGRGEGCGVVVLKRLADALADGDRVLAIVRGSAVNQDGPSSSLTAPSGPAQERVIRAALERAGLPPHAIGYIEAHGTGTALGDPMELGALGSVFAPGRRRDTPLWIGSAKTNLGHLEAAAGIIGVIKVVLGLQHGVIPPHLHYRTPNPHIPWHAWPFRVPTEAVAWPVVDGGRRAGVSSFGFSGTNAHVVLEEAPAVPARSPAVERSRHILALSARTPTALAATASRLATALGAFGDDALGDVAATLNRGRAQLPVRAPIVVDSIAAARLELDRVATGAIVPTRVSPSAQPRVAFLFTGQGSQYAGMAAALHRTSPVFREAIEAAIKHLDPQLPASVRTSLLDEGAGSAIDQTGLAQPALFALQYALDTLWRSWGVQPAAVLGHSVGEIAAAGSAGILTLADAATLVAARARLMQALPADGGMLSVFAPLDALAPWLATRDAGVELAAHNSPDHVVVSGALASLEALETELAAARIRFRRLAVSHAFHSALMEPMLPAFKDVLARVTFHAPRVRLISNVTGDAVDDRVRTVDYWLDHVRRPVRFAAGMSALARLGCNVMVEVGPTATLVATGRTCLPDTDITWCTSLKRGKDPWSELFESLRALTVAGVPVTWEGVEQGYDRRKVDLPTYPFQHTRSWFVASPRPATVHHGVPGDTHPLLGRRLASPLPQAQFESLVGPDTPAFIRDHQAGGVILLPATAYLELGRAAGRAVFGPGVIGVDDLMLREAMVFDEEAPRLVHTIVEPAAGDHAVFRVQSTDVGGTTGWTLHAEGSLPLTASEAREAGSDALDAASARCGPVESSERLYADQRTQGFEFGPRFRGVQTVQRGPGESVGSIELPEAERASASAYGIHPALLDAAVQVMGGAISAAEASGEHAALHVPVTIRRFRLFRPPGPSGRSHVVLNAASRPGQAYDVTVRLVDERGELVAEIDGLELQRVEGTALTDLLRSRAQVLHERSWEPQPHTADVASSSGHDQGSASAMHWLILADQDGVGEALASTLSTRGEPCTLVARSTKGPAADAQALADTLRTHAAASTSCGVVDLRWLDVADASERSDRDEPLSLALDRTFADVRAALATPEHARPRLWIVTRGAQAIAGSGTAVSVAQAAAWGLGRSLALEHPELQTVNVDLDPSSEPDEVAALADELTADGHEPQVARRDGRRLVARLVRATSTAEAASSPSGENYTLGTRDHGGLDGLELAPVARRPPEAHEVEISVEATGLNFRDVLNVLGLYPGPAGPIGAECAGIVTRVGSSVAGVKPGDRVVASAHAAFSRFVVTRRQMVHPLPSTCSMVEAAALPIAYLTAAYALQRLGGMREGETVLIHAAAGGVGLAAVHLARRAGLRVIATAGSRSKRAYLTRLGVDHVFDSRSLGFVEATRAVTNGRGADLVLNSLSDEFVEASLRALADGGRFLEIGKRGIWSHDQVNALNRGIRYHIIDVGATGEALPDDISSLLGEVLRDVGRGHLPKLPLRVFPLSEARQAFRVMMQARQIGKIVLTHATRDSHVASQEPRTSTDTTPPCRADGTYLITGGLSGIGLHVAGWLAEHGARHLVLVSRRGETADAREAIAALRGRGVHVHAVAADVADAAAVESLLAQLHADGPPLRGIVHGASVLDDGAFTSQTWERVDAVLRPKLGGAATLEHLTRETALDWFVVFSSVAAVMGSGGQANYAAANAMLDAFVHERRRLGRHLQVINWGPWRETGMAARAGLQAHFEKLGVRPMSPREGLRAFGAALAAPGAQYLAVAADWPRLARLNARAGLAALVSRLMLAAPATTTSNGVGPDATSLRTALAAAAPGRRRVVASTFVRRRVAEVLGLDQAATVDEQTPLGELGMDSLLAVELRNSLSRSTETPLPATLLFDHPTLARLVDHVCDEVLGLDAPESGVHAPHRLDDSSDLDLLTDITQLSDEEIDRLWAAKQGRGIS